MSSPRGTRPKGPRRWPQQAEAKRQETQDIAQEIARLAAEIRKNPQRNPYLTGEMLADIQMWAERIQRLMVEAKQGVDEAE